MPPVEERAVEALLRARTLADLDAFVHELGLGRGALKQALAARGSAAEAAGLRAEVALLEFLDEQVDRLLPDPRGSSAGPGTLQQLVRAAAGEAGPLDAFLLLRRHEHLLDVDDPVADAHLALLTPRLNLPRGAGPAVAALSVWRGDARQRLNGRLVWAAFQRDRGQLAHAVRHVDRAVAEARAAGLPASALAAARMMQGTLHDQRGENEAAAEAFLEALRFLDAGPAAMVRYQLAGCLRALGMRADALAALTTALGDITGSTPDGEVLAGRCLNLRGLVHEDLGDHDEGAADHAGAVALFARAGDRPREFGARTNLAANHLKRGHDTAGINAMRDIVRTVERWGHPAVTARARNNLGTALLHAGRPEAAAAEYSAALAALDPGTPSTSAAIALFGLGDTVRERGGGAETVGSLYTAALVTGIEAGDALSNLRTYLSRADGTWGTDEEFRSFLRLGREEAVAQGDVGALTFVVEAGARRLERAGDPAAAVEVLRSQLADCAARGFRGPEVTRLRVRCARLLRQDLREPQQAFELLWSALSETTARLDAAVLDERRAEVVAESVAVYEGLVDLLTTDGHLLDLPDGRAAGELAFDLHEAARSRSFAAALADSRLPRPRAVPAELCAAEDSLLVLERELQEHLVGDPSAGGRRRIERLRETRERLRQVRELVRPWAPEYVRSREGEPLTLREVRPLLSAADPSTPVAVVSYFCTPTGTTCFLLRPDGELRVHRSPLTRERVEEVARWLRATFNGDPSAFPPTPPIRRRSPHRRSLDRLDELGAALLGFEDDVAAGTLLCVAAHGPLHLVPFHALRRPGGEPLGERYPVVYAPSLSALAYSLQRDVAEPVSGTAFVAGVSAASGDDTDAFEHDDQLFAGRWDTRVARGPGASPEAVLAGMRDAEIVHLTCHGHFDERDPSRSGLLLGDGASRPPAGLAGLSRMQRNRFLLSTQDIARSPLAARLVTMRACSTAVQGQRNRGDEFEGLVRSLLYAGAGAVVASLWNVDEPSSRRMLRVFYERLARGAPAWRALWEAQRHLRACEDEPYLAHPYHWAPLVLIGDWR
ncbi:hypothetical protein NUM3379_41310 [Kineococcus sp. NUM-3379]